MGAGTALLLALAHPERVERMILQSPPPFGADVKAARQMLGGLATLYQLFGTSLAARIVMALPQMRRLDREGAAGDDLREFLARQQRAGIVPAIKGLLGGPPIPVERLGEIATSAVLPPDDAIHPGSGEILHERMPHAKLAVAPSATYWQENSAALTHVVASFVLGKRTRACRRRHRTTTRRPDSHAHVAFRSLGIRFRSIGIYSNTMLPIQ
jgi:pimeloyl-ACP methyl ester carboxylesterase